MITKVQFTNFRGFRDLTLDGLKRVNLIVGPNNCGKTSLLEGLCLLCEPKRLNELPGRLRFKDQDEERRYFRWLIRDTGLSETCEMSCRTTERTETPALEVILRKEAQAERQRRGNRPRATAEAARSAEWHVVYDGRIMGAYVRGDGIGRCCIISAENRQAGQLVHLFGTAQRMKGGEEALTGLLHEVDPRINKIRIDPDHSGNQLIVDVGLSELIPLTQLGQGVQRLVTIFAEVIGDTPKAVLIDEIENGVHYAVQETVWAGLAAMAERLDVQVFATTHSKECLEAAHRAFAEHENDALRVIRLFRVESGPQGRVLDRKHIEAALAGDIDLR